VVISPSRSHWRVFTQDAVTVVGILYPATVLALDRRPNTSRSENPPPDSRHQILAYFDTDLMTCPPQSAAERFRQAGTPPGWECSRRSMGVQTKKISDRAEAADLRAQTARSELDRLSSITGDVLRRSGGLLSWLTCYLATSPTRAHNGVRSFWFLRLAANRPCSEDGLLGCFCCPT